LGFDVSDYRAQNERVVLRIERVHAVGLAQEFNAARKNKALKKGDLIVEVNGVHGESKDLREVLERDLVLDMLIMRGV
jgi:hypothetical protein